MPAITEALEQMHQFTHSVAAQGVPFPMGETNTVTDFGAE
jgi:hypothetical protein